MSNETATLVKLSAAEQAAAIKKGDVTSRELVEAHLKVMSCRAVHQGLPEGFRRCGSRAGRRLRRQVRRGKAALPELAGVPIAIKDMIVTKGIETTAASKILEGWVPPYDATVIEKLKAAGMQFSARPTSTNSPRAPPPSTPPTRPPTTRGIPTPCPAVPVVASASAVAAFEAPIALGTDTVQPIRQPTPDRHRGRQTHLRRRLRFGAIAMASSLDQIGPVSRTVLDSALLQEIIGGHDERLHLHPRRPAPDGRRRPQGTSAI